MLDDVVNLDIMVEPMNWLIVILMLVIGAFAVALVMNYLNGNG